MPLFTDLEGQSDHSWMTVCVKTGLYLFDSDWFVQMLHYFGSTIQLALRVFYIKIKNLAFDTSIIITNAWFSMKN